MTPPKRTTLKFKLTAFASLLVIFVALSFSYFIRRGQKEAIIERLETNRVDTVKALRQVAREGIIMNDETGLINYVQLLKRSQTIAYAMVIDPTGKILVHTDALEIGKTLSDPAAQAALATRSAETPLIQNLIDKENRPVVDMTVPIMTNISPAEFNGVARIGYDKEAVDKIVSSSLADMDRHIAIAFVLALLLGLGGAFIFAWVMAQPIQTLIAGARKIGEGKLDHRINVSSNDELKDLADEFNLMAVKLGELDQMKQDFVSNVTHELRSPLTSIRGYLDLLIQEAAGKITTLQKDYLSVVKNSTVRLGRFIDNLLDVAKIEANKLKLSPEEVDLNGLAHEMEVLFKPQLDEKKLSFTNAVPKTTAHAFVDRDKFAEILINLTSNAIKFTPPEGNVRLECSEGPNYVEMRLQDSGVGIPTEMIGKLFNKFEQVKSTQGLARNQKGTGLGLAIVKGIVEAHGGKIWITSPAPSTGKGTVFHFTVPKLTDELKAKLNG
jgi:signal transduction histidine kinase